MLLGEVILKYAARLWSLITVMEEYLEAARTSEGGFFS